MPFQVRIVEREREGERTRKKEKGCSFEIDWLLMTSSEIVGEDEDDHQFTRPLGRLSVFFYGVGHMLNDITASCWFTYLLLFLTQIGLSPRSNFSSILSDFLFTKISSSDIIV